MFKNDQIYYHAYSGAIIMYLCRSQRISYTGKYSFVLIKNNSSKEFKLVEIHDSLICERHFSEQQVRILNDK